MKGDGEPAELEARFRAGDVVHPDHQFALDYLLLERFHATWPTWEAWGNYWQWRYLDLHTGAVNVILENALARWIAY